MTGGGTMAAGYSAPFRFRGSGFLTAVSGRFFRRAPMLAHAGPAPLSPFRGLPGILRDRVAIGAALPGFLIPAIHRRQVGRSFASSASEG